MGGLRLLGGLLIIMGGFPIFVVENSISMIFDIVLIYFGFPIRKGPPPGVTPSESVRRIWTDLVGFGRIWTDLDGFGRIWTDSDGFGRIWSDFSITKKKVLNGLILRLESPL